MRDVLYYEKNSMKLKQRLAVTKQNEDIEELYKLEEEVRQQIDNIIDWQELLSDIQMTRVQITRYNRRN